MANESILISEVIPATPERIFSAWLDSGEHSSFTGSQAAVLPFVGGAYSAWDGYVQGKTLELIDGTRIVQSWRTTEFPGDSPDSRLELTLEPTQGGTLLTLLHTDIPAGHSHRVRDGWNEYYLSRMKAYFSDAADVFEGDNKDFKDALEAFGAAEFESMDFPTAGPGASVPPSPEPQPSKPTPARKPAKAPAKVTAKVTAKPATEASGKRPASATLKATAKAKARKPARSPAKKSGLLTKKAHKKANKVKVKAKAKKTRSAKPAKARAKVAKSAKTAKSSGGKAAPRKHR